MYIMYTIVYKSYIANSLDIIFKYSKQIQTHITKEFVILFFLNLQNISEYYH